MNSKHCERLLKLFRFLEAEGYTNIGIVLNDSSLGKENLGLHFELDMEIFEKKPQKKREN